MPKKIRRTGIDEYGRSALHYAIIDQADDLIKKCLESGLNINQADDNGWTPLHFACQNYNLSHVKILVENGAKIDPIDNHGNTPLWRAIFNCGNQSGEIIKYLLVSGADPNLKNKSEVSPLDLAISIGNYPVKDHFK